MVVTHIVRYNAPLSIEGKQGKPSMVKPRGKDPGGFPTMVVNCVLRPDPGTNKYTRTHECSVVTAARPRTGAPEHNDKWRAQNVAMRASFRRLCAATYVFWGNCYQNANKTHRCNAACVLEMSAFEPETVFSARFYAYSPLIAITYFLSLTAHCFRSIGFRCVPPAGGNFASQNAKQGTPADMILNRAWK